jgi:hypothetical protein
MPMWSLAPGPAEIEGEAIGAVSVLTEAAHSEGAPSMCAMEPAPTTSQMKQDNTTLGRSMKGSLDGRKRLTKARSIG